MIYQSALLRLHSFQLSEVHQFQLACTPTDLATSKKPTGAAIRRPHTPRGGSACETSTLTAANVCSSKLHLQSITPRWKHSLAWNKITAENHCTAEVHLRSRPTISNLLYQSFSTAISVMATLVEIQPHRIAMKSSVTLEPSPACQVHIYMDTLLQRNPPTEEDQSTN